MKQFLILYLLLIAGCSKEPKNINYGEDKCDYCTMTIIDKPYATELVTDKGKAYKFDSAECMLNYIEENNKNYFYYLTNTKDKPGNLIDAKTAFYLVSENLPSPMGANITAFTTKELAEKAQLEYKGKVYDFHNLKENYVKKPREQPH